MPRRITDVFDREQETEDRELLFRMKLTVLGLRPVHQLGGKADGGLHGLVAEVGAGG